jgi:hypothetical protein
MRPGHLGLLSGQEAAARSSAGYCDDFLNGSLIHAYHAGSAFLRENDGS